MVKLDEKWSNWMKILAIRKWVFEKKSPKLAFSKKNSPSGDISPVKETLHCICWWMPWCDIWTSSNLYLWWQALPCSFEVCPSVWILDHWNFLVGLMDIWKCTYIPLDQKADPCKPDMWTLPVMLEKFETGLPHRRSQESWSIYFPVVQKSRL
jgi:hypothetical protein